MLAGLGARETQIDGDGESQVLIVTANSTASIFNLTIQDGSNASRVRREHPQQRRAVAALGADHPRPCGEGRRDRQPPAAAGSRSSARSSTTTTPTSAAASTSSGGADPTPSHARRQRLDVRAQLLAEPRRRDPDRRPVQATLVHATIARNTGGGGLAITSGEADVELYGSLLAGNLAAATARARPSRSTSSTTSTTRTRAGSTTRAASPTPIRGWTRICATGAGPPT